MTDHICQSSCCEWFACARSITEVELVLWVKRLRRGQSILLYQLVKSHPPPPSITLTPPTHLMLNESLWIIKRPSCKPFFKNHRFKLIVSCLLFYYSEMSSLKFTLLSFVLWNIVLNNSLASQLNLTLKKFYQKGRRLKICILRILR